MKPRSVIYKPTAQADIDNIRDFIADGSPENAATFIPKLISHINKIATSGADFQLRPEYGPGRRIAAFGRFTAVYETTNDTITVLRIFGGQDIATHMGFRSVLALPATNINPTDDDKS